MSLEYIGLAKSNGSPEGDKAVVLWAEICTKQHKTQLDWIADLRTHGIKAAHPDDGWVDREKNYVSFTYPQFFDGLNDGDFIALGWPDKYRIVRVTKFSESDRYVKFGGPLMRGAYFETDQPPRGTGRS